MAFSNECGEPANNRQNKAKVLKLRQGTNAQGDLPARLVEVLIQISDSLPQWRVASLPSVPQDLPLWFPRCASLGSLG